MRLGYDQAMDETKTAAARQMVRELAVELEQAAAAARAAVTAADKHDDPAAWKELQALYARFDQASQLLRDMRRVVDAALAPPK